MGPRPAGNCASDKLENLQRRHQILEGEKRSIEETAAVQIKANKEAIRRLHETNNKLRGEISASSKGSDFHSEANSNMEELIKLKNKFNAVRSENMRKEQLVEQLKKQVEIIASNSSTSEEVSVTDRRIRVLENRIDKAMIKYNEAQSIKKTYEGILHRLKEERVGFDHQLENLEKQLEAKKKDYEELLLLSHDALHAKEMAQAELHRFEQAVMEERNQRDREVMEKKLLVQQRIEMNHRLERKEKETISLHNNVPNTVVPNDNILPEQPKITHSASDETLKIQQRLNEYEEAYSKLKEVTGVSDVNEIIQKFISQEITFTNLTKLTREQERNIEALNEEHEKLKSQLDELKFSTAALTNGRHSASVDAESLVAESMSKLEKNRTRYEKLAKVLIDVNSGVGHLYDKLSWIKLEDQQSSEVLVLTDETLEEVLNVCELKVTKLMHYVDRSPQSDLATDKTAISTPDIRVRGPADGSANVDDVDFDPGAPSGPGIENDFFNRKLIKSNSALFVDKVKKYV